MTAKSLSTSIFSELTTYTPEVILTFIQVTCPNCSAPLNAIKNNHSAKCQYCLTEFIIRTSTNVDQKSNLANDRAAAELTLQRLRREQKELQKKLQEANNRTQLREDEDWKEKNLEQDNYIENYLKNLNNSENSYRQSRNITLSLVFFALWTPWAWPWYIVLVSLIFWIAFTININLIKSKYNHPASIPTPGCVYTYAEIRMAADLEILNAEIDKIRNFLEASKPSYH